MIMTTAGNECIADPRIRIVSESSERPSDENDRIRLRWVPYRRRRKPIWVALVILCILIVLITAGLLIYLIVQHAYSPRFTIDHTDEAAICSRFAKNYCAVDPCSYVPRGHISVEFSDIQRQIRYDIGVKAMPEILCTCDLEYPRKRIARAFLNSEFSLVRVIIPSNISKEYHLSRAWVMYCGALWARRIPPIEAVKFCGTTRRYQPLLRNFRILANQKDYQDVASFGVSLLLATECSPGACLKKSGKFNKQLAPSPSTRDVALRFLYEITNVHM